MKSGRAKLQQLRMECDVLYDVQAIWQ